MEIADIKINNSYRVVCGFDERFMNDTVVTVMEIRESDLPFVYCYGSRGGSAYININNLKKK